MNVRGVSSGKVALVTGASRGAGRAIAVALGARGATVYVTGSQESALEELAGEITRSGGNGVAELCDPGDHTEAKQLLVRIQRERRRPDVLVNAAGLDGIRAGEGCAPPGASRPAFWSEPFVSAWADSFEAGLRTMLLFTWAAAPLMTAARSGLIVNTMSWDRGFNQGDPFRDAARAAIVRATAGMAREMRRHGVAAVVLAPGPTRADPAMPVYAPTALDMTRADGPAYMARAVLALAADSAVMRWSGDVLYVGDLLRTYGPTDDRAVQPLRSAGQA